MKLLARVRSARKSKLFRYGWKVTLLALIAASGLAVFLFYGAWAQTFDMKKVGEMPERNTVFDVDGKIYSRLAGANRLKVSLSEVSPFFIAAVLVREDARFYEHKGIDWRGILRRWFATSSAARPRKAPAASPSSLPATVFRSVAARSAENYWKPWWLCASSAQFTKQQILELYVNRIYFGAGCYGVETASQAYFGKNASQLNLPEAALLAGLIRGPNRFSPLKNPEGAAMQRNAVSGSPGGIEKNVASASRRGKAHKNQSASEASAFHPGELCDGRGSAGFEWIVDTRPDR